MNLPHVVLRPSSRRSVAAPTARSASIERTERIRQSSSLTTSASYWMVLCAVALLPILGGCATDPKKGASIVYRLPKTQVKVVLSVDVTKCSPSPVLNSTLTINAVALPRDPTYSVDGGQLASSVTKRGLTISVDDRGVISGVNAAVSDQKAVILGNVIKLAATFSAGAVAPQSYDGSSGSTLKILCSTKTKSSLDTADDIERLIDKLSTTVPSETSVESRQKQIGALASQLAVLKGSLHKEVVATLDIVSLDAGQKPLKFDFKPFEALLTTTVTYADKSKISVHGVTALSQGLFAADLAYVPDKAGDALSSGNPHGTRDCTMSMKVPSQDRMRFEVLPTGVMITPVHPGENIEAVIPTSMPAGEPLCLSTVFGENRTVGLKFDKFGQVQEFSWSSDATAANVTSAMAGSMPDATGLLKSLHDRDLAADKAELDRLITEQSLRKARACQVALDAGATSCP